MTETAVVTPDVPGTPEVTETVETPDTDQQPQGLSPDKLAELNRTLRDERNQWKREAREAKERSEALTRQFSELKTQLGVDKEADFDPKSEVAKLRSELESERVERQRAEVARTTGVDPEDIKGSTTEAMQASAERYLERFNARLEAALKSKNVPAAPPASTVTSNDPIGGPQQITSREELAKLTPAEQMTAYKDGRLNTLIRKSE